MRPWSGLLLLASLLPLCSGYKCLRPEPKKPCHGQYCYSRTWEQGGKRVSYPKDEKGCDDGKLCPPGKGIRCTKPEPIQPHVQTCCCESDKCNQEPYFWMTCLDTQGAVEQCDLGSTHKQEPTTGACFVKRNKDGNIVRGCEWKTGEAKDQECHALEWNPKKKTTCRGHGIEAVCCCYQPNCNDPSLLPEIPEKCWEWGKESATATNCPEKTEFCYGSSWVQGGTRFYDRRQNGSGCDTKNLCASGEQPATDNMCTVIETEAPHEQTCCCRASGCNENPFFWLTCLDSNGEKEFCGVTGKEPTGNCYITKSFSSEGNATGGCEWKSKKEEDMPCTNIGWNAAVDNMFCHVDTKKNTKTCCCVESNCNTPDMVTTTTTTTAGQGKINGRHTMIVLALFTRLFFFN